MSEYDDDLLEELGGMLAELVELVGLQAALRIVERWGGIRFYVPEAQHLRPTHPLVKAVGAQAARAIAEHFGREEILVPRAVRLLRAARDRRIRAEHAGGDSASVLSLRWHLSLRQVRYILAASDTDGAAAHVDARQLHLL